MHTIESGTHVRHPRRTTPFAFPTITPMEGAGFFSLGGNSDRGYAASWIWTSENSAYPHLGEYTLSESRPYANCSSQRSLICAMRRPLGACDPFRTGFP